MPCKWLRSSLLVLLLPLALHAAEKTYLVKGVTIYDGGGKEPVKGDLLIKGERIVGVGTVEADKDAVVLDGTGLIAAPGFIDLHTHSDDALTSKKTRSNLNYLTQGVTTVVTGNCGSGPVDAGDYFATMEKYGVGSNVIHLAPHNSIRRKVMGNVNRPPSADELKKMEDLVDKAMRDGAWGMSTGLIYNPGTYSRTDELIALAKVASKHGGMYASHIRNEGTQVLDATEEILTIGREAKLPVHISHMKASGPKAWGLASDQVALVEKARKAGQVVTADQYPYTASSTLLSATVIPARFREGSKEDFEERLKDPDQAKIIRKGIADTVEGRDGANRVRLASYKPNPKWVGKTLAEIAKDEKKDVVDLVLEIEKNGGAGIINFGIKEEDMRLIMRQPFVATASDGSARVPDDETMPHPRSYGTFPRKIAEYAVKEKVITVEQAIRSCSGLPADILALPERGYIKKGYYADVVILDLKEFKDVATYDKPHQYSTGIKYLFVNGTLTIKDGKYTDALAGKVLRHKEPAKS